MNREVFHPSMIPGSFQERSFLLSQIITFGYIASMLFSFIAYNKNVGFNLTDTSLYPQHLIAMISVSLILFLIKFLNYRFKKIEVYEKTMNIVDSMWVPKINKQIDLSNISSLEFRKSLNLDSFKRPYNLWIYQVFFTSSNKQNKVPLQGWDKQTLSLVLGSIKKHAPQLKVSTKTGLSILGSY